MKIALAQMKMLQSMEENFDKTVMLINEAAKKGAQLICFPEIQLTPFFPQYKKTNDKTYDYAIDTDHKYIRELCKLCKERHIFAAPNFYIIENGKYYDMSLLINDDGSIAGSQKMVHIAQCNRFYEQDYYTPSEDGFKVFDTSLGKIGIVVCFDRHYPESIRTEALRGAELIIIPTANTSAEPDELFEWEIRVQAFQNSVNIAMCNRVGAEDEMEFNGRSLICNESGNVVAIASDREQLLYAEIDIKRALQIRAQMPYTSLRRKELYE